MELLPFFLPFLLLVALLYPFINDSFLTLFAGTQKKPELASSKSKKQKPRNKTRSTSNANAAIKPVVDKKPILVSTKENALSIPEKNIPEIFCVNSAYENLLNIINSEEDYFEDFAGIWKAIFASAEVRNNFRSVQRQRGPLLCFALDKKHKQIASFLLKEANPFADFAAEEVDGIEKESIEFALKEHLFSAVLSIASSPSFDSSKFPFLLHELVKSFAPINVIQGLLKEGKYQACTRDTHHLSIFDYAIILKRKDLLDYLIETGCCNINEPAGRFFSAPIYLAIRTGELEIVKSVLSHPEIDLNQCSLIFTNPLEFLTALLEESEPLDISNKILSKEFLLDCQKLIEESRNQK